MKKLLVMLLCVVLAFPGFALGDAMTGETEVSSDQNVSAVQPAEEAVAQGSTADGISTDDIAHNVPEALNPEDTQFSVGDSQATQDEVFDPTEHEVAEYFILSQDISEYVAQESVADETPAPDYGNQDNESSETEPVPESREDSATEIAESESPDAVGEIEETEPEVQELLVDGVVTTTEAADKLTTSTPPDLGEPAQESDVPDAPEATSVPEEGLPVTGEFSPSQQDALIADTPEPVVDDGSVTFAQESSVMVAAPNALEQLNIEISLDCGSIVEEGQKVTATWSFTGAALPLRALVMNWRVLYTNGEYRAISYTDVSSRTSSYIVEKGVERINVWVFVIDANESNTHRRSEYIDVIPAPPMSFTNFTVSPRTIHSGESVTARAAVRRAVGSVSYTYYLLRDGSIVYTAPGTTASSRTFKVTTPGNYEVQVTAVDLETSVTTSAPFTVVQPEPLRINSLNLSATSIPSGGTITADTLVSGGVGTPTYTYYLLRDGKVVYTAPSSTRSSRSFAVTTPGSYRVRVIVKDATGTLAAGTPFSVIPPEPLSVNSLALSAGSIYSGSTLTASASVSGGSGAVTYTFYLLRDGKVVYTAPSSTRSSRTFTVTTPGNYRVRVIAKDSATTAAAGVPFIVLPPAPLSISDLSLSTTALYSQEPLTVHTTVSGGAGTVNYTYYLLRDGVVVHTAATTTNSFRTFTITTPGSYRIRVIAKDASTTVAAGTPFTVYAPRLISE